MNQKQLLKDLRRLEAALPQHAEVLHAASQEITNLQGRINLVSHVLQRDARYYEKRVHQPTRAMARWARSPDRARLSAVMEEQQQMAVSLMQLNGILIGKRGDPHEDTRARDSAMCEAIAKEVQQ